MKRFLMALPAVLITVSAIWGGGDTYLYRVPIASKSKTQLKAQVADIESKDEKQPFFKTYVLDEGSTNYYLLKVTPEDGQDPNLPYELYQIQYLDEEGFIRKRVDNSKTFPIFKRDEPFVVEKDSSTEGK